MLGRTEQLLGEEKVQGDQKDPAGRTPLPWTAGIGEEVVVNMLLSREEIDPNFTDGNGRTALIWAVAEGHEEIVKLLLNKEVNPEQPDNDGRTPLSWAAGSGSKKVVDLLLERVKEIALIIKTKPVERHYHGRQKTGERRPCLHCLHYWEVKE